MMNKKRLALVIFLLFLSQSNLCPGARVLERKSLYKVTGDCIDMRPAGLFIDSDNTVFVLRDNFLYVNNDWIKTDEYGRLLNGFVDQGRFYMAFEKDGNIDIYRVKKDFELACRIKIKEVPNILWRWAGFQRIFPMPGEDNSYMLQGSCGKFPTNPFGFVFCFTSGGHGIIYSKPILAKIQNGKMTRYLKFRYKGKLDESFTIAETVKSDESINLLGYRKLEEPAFGPDKYPPQPVILYYADYNLEKKKVKRNHVLCENTPGYDKNTDSYLSYGPLSMDSFGEDVFVVFSWRKESRINNRTKFDIKFVNSDIYFRQCGKDRLTETEKIAEGLSAVVRADSLGNVHIIWVNNDGVFFHKARNDGVWSKAEIILQDANLCPSVAFSWNMIFAEFDKNNHLRIVYPSKSDLVCAKIGFD